MMYKKGDRVLYNRQKFGTVHYGQSSSSEVAVAFDRDGALTLVRPDTLELVADAQHEAALYYLINSGSGNQPTATELFGEEWSTHVVHSCRVKGGTAYWVTDTIDDTRRVYEQHTFVIRWDDGSEGDGVMKLEGQRELDLWTKFL